ncbi:MAG: hypothetical protein AMXMBFR64_23410 [Myxococcales bacterium]
MKTAGTEVTWMKTSLAALAAVALLVLALPVLAAASIAARIVVPVVVLGAVAVLLLVPSLRRRVVLGEDEMQYRGLRVPLEGLLHSAHTWVKERRGSLVAGVDDLMLRVLGPVDRVELPAVGTVLAAGAPMARLHGGGRSITVRAPVAGRVEATNDRLDRDPSLLVRSPYRDGWAVRIAPSEQPTGLLSGTRATRWFASEVDGLLSMLSGPTLGHATMHDGGAVTDALHEDLDDLTFRRVSARFFGGEC